MDLLVSAAAVTRLQGAVERLAKQPAAAPVIVPRHSGVIEPGQTDNRIVAVRSRLAQLARGLSTQWGIDDSRAGAVAFYDDTLARSVSRFQRQFGLLPDGRISPQTVDALNVTLVQRLAQLRKNLALMQQWQRVMRTPRYVLVNIPALDLYAVQDNRIALHSDVIVGRQERATPVISAAIRAVNVHPSWHVPPSIIRSDLFDKFTSDPAYFERRGFRVYGPGGQQPIDPLSVAGTGLKASQLRLVQQPGPMNALGRVRIDMPNALSVYLHDTPVPRLFGWPDRLFSAGCVRVARVVELAAWLIGEDGQPKLPAMTDALRASDPVNFRLRNTVPVHFIYLTAWVDASGVIQFRPDVYQRHLAGA